MEEKTYTATIVSQSRPYLTKEGNSWIADAVYKKGDEYITRKVLVPNVQHGPYEIGEKVEISEDINDQPADEYQRRIYENPDMFKSIMLDKKYKETNYEPISVQEKKISILSVVIVLLVVLILAFVLYILLSSSGTIPKLF